MSAHLSEKFPPNIASFVIIVGDEFWYFIVSLSRGVVSAFLKWFKALDTNLFNWLKISKLWASINKRDTWH